MNVDALRKMLRQMQEKQGYYFNCDEKITGETLAGMLVNKERLGYMACPCRLPVGARTQDLDIICPCEYREADVREYGCCYCNLYVSSEFNKKGGGRMVIPDRRPEDWMDD